MDDDCVSREWHIADALAGSGGREPKAEAADSAGWDPDAVTEASERRPRVARDPLVVDHAERLAGLGSWEWLPATGELVWSDNMFRLYGLEAGAIVPSPEYVVERVHPDDLARVMATLEALTAGEPRSVEYRFRRDDGEVILLRATVAVVSESEAGDLRIIGLVQDLTAQRRLEREVAARVAVTEAVARGQRHGAAGGSGAGDGVCVRCVVGP